MLDTFRKRDNVRPSAPGQSGAPVSAATPASAQPPAPAVGPASRLEPPPPASIKAVLLDTPAPGLATAATPAPAVAPAPAALQQPASVQQSSSARLTVGPDIKLKGAEITDCDTLIVEGQVDAAMDSRVMEIAENGVFRGKVQVEIAEIRGRFEGELTAHKQLVIRETGWVSGKIRYGKIRIDEGGEVSGDIAAIHGSTDSQRSGGRPREGAPALAAAQTQR